LASAAQRSFRTRYRVSASRPGRRNVVMAQGGPGVCRPKQSAAQRAMRETNDRIAGMTIYLVATPAGPRRTDFGSIFVKCR